MKPHTKSLFSKEIVENNQFVSNRSSLSHQSSKNDLEEPSPSPKKPSLWGKLRGSIVPEPENTSTLKEEEKEAQTNQEENENDQKEESKMELISNTSTLQENPFTGSYNINKEDSKEENKEESKTSTLHSSPNPSSPTNKANKAELEAKFSNNKFLSKFLHKQHLQPKRNSISTSKPREELQNQKDRHSKAKGLFKGIFSKIKNIIKSKKNEETREIPKKPFNVKAKWMKAKNILTAVGRWKGIKEDIQLYGTHNNQLADNNLDLFIAQKETQQHVFIHSFIHTSIHTFINKFIHLYNNLIFVFIHLLIICEFMFF
jgi:hypothetical protein